MDEPETERLTAEKNLTNKYLSGELTFAEYSQNWLAPGEGEQEEEDININETEEPDPEEQEEEDGEDEEQEDNDSEEDETVETFQGTSSKSKYGSGECYPRTRRRQRRHLTPALAGLMGEANLRYVRGDHETAEKICYEIIRQIPTAHEPFQTLAQIYENDPEKSLEFSLIAAHLNPDAKEWLRLATILKEKGDVKKELFCLTRAVKANPKDITNHLIRIERLDYLEKNNMVPVSHLHSIICRISLMNFYPDSEGKTVVEMAKSIASEYHANNKINNACNVMDKAYKRFSELFSFEDLNLYLELLIAQKEFEKCMDIFVAKGGVEIEAEVQTVSEDGNVQEVMNIISCNIPTSLPVDLRTKLIICLIHLKAFHLVDSYIDDMIENEDVEATGDIFLDVEEALTSEGRHSEAFRLLAILVKSKNYSLPAVWLQYAECLSNLNRTLEAIDAYRTVVKLAPQHLGARIQLSALLKDCDRLDEAYMALEQEENGEALDTSLLYERCVMLKSSENKREYLKIGYLLLSRHFYTVRDKSEVSVLIIKDVYDQLKVLREARGEPFEEINPTLFEENCNKLTLEVEWELLKDMFSVSYELAEYPTLQRISFLALASKRFAPYRRSLEFVSLLASYYNSDPYFAFSLLRDFVIKMADRISVWNLMALVLQKSEKPRTHKFLIRYLQKQDNYDKQINILLGNYYIRSRRYKCALKEYLVSYNSKPTSLCALLCAVTMIQIASQKFAINKNRSIAQAVAFFKAYERMRGDSGSQEFFYNLGRAYHQLGLSNLACSYYKRALDECNDLIASNPDVFDLRREIAFNLHLIYKNNCPQLATMYLLKYIVL